MNHDEEDWKKKLEEVSVVQRCPKCGSLTLSYDKSQNKIKCSKCNYEQNMEKME